MKEWGFAVVMVVMKRKEMRDKRKEFEKKSLAIVIEVCGLRRVTQVHYILWTLTEQGSKIEIYFAKLVQSLLTTLFHYSYLILLLFHLLQKNVTQTFFILIHPWTPHELGIENRREKIKCVCARSTWPRVRFLCGYQRVYCHLMMSMYHYSLLYRCPFKLFNTGFDNLQNYY